MRQGRLTASFRDPRGFVFERDGVLFRQVNRSHADDYELLRSSGLYDRLVEDGLLIPHEEVGEEPLTHESYRVIRPEPVSFVSYPYEWCPGQLRDAALATLEIQERALDAGMSLRDASAYNVQFHDGRPVLIDTLSFEKIEEGRPWVAYRQFCQHFVAPLSLMSYRDARYGHLLRYFLDGIPLELATRSLPWGTRIRPGLGIHLHAHERSMRKHEAAGRDLNTRSKFGERAFRGLVDSLRSTVSRLTSKPTSSWATYYDDGESYEGSSFASKESVVAGYLDELRPGSVWDLGSNVGVFSRLASRRGIKTVAFDQDVAAVEASYVRGREERDGALLPLVQDLTNPSPSLGWHHRERLSLIERGPADLALALALIHHLAIGNNVPLPDIAEFLRATCSWLVVEFVPKEDRQVSRLLRSREDIFSDYTVEGFERAFASSFDIRDRRPIDGSKRSLYLMKGL